MALIGKKEWPIFFKKSKVLYYPVPSLGFDSSCRGEWKLPMPKRLNNGRYYPWYPIVINFKLRSFKKSLREAIKFLLINKISFPIVHIASWNEWSEGNHLEPGEKSKFAYLDAIKEVL